MTTAPAPVRTRPELDLGPMTGTPEYIKERAEALVRAFAGLLDVEEIKLVDSSPEGGKTDCHSTIWAPLQDTEGYLVVEHELSHWLFETDVVLVKKFLETFVGKLLNAAGITMGTDQALPYEKQLMSVIHQLWNCLEDWRCCWAWTQLYYGGGTLLQERWRDIAEHEYPKEALKENLVMCLGAYAAGVDTKDVPQAFEDCKRPMRRALNLVEGVDAVACLAITARLVREIIEVLLDNNPPVPPQPQGGQGRGQPSGGGGAQSPAQQREQRKQEALQVLKLLAGAIPRTGKFAGQKTEAGGGTLGGPDVAMPPDKEVKRRERREGQLAKVQALVNADDKDTDETGTTPFQHIMAQGADDLEARLEEARRAMMRNQDDSSEAEAQVHLGWSQEVGIPIVRVTSSQGLPPPTAVAYENRRILEQLRMKKRRKKDFEGELNTDALLNAIGAGELDRPFYEKVVKVPRFELLFLFDVSGSMTIGQALPLTERALADSVFAVQAIRSKAYMWGFSDALYVFDVPGSPKHTSAIRYGSTCMVQALDVAHKWGRKAPTKRAVMLVTDGWPTSCRARNSTGNPLTDLHAVLQEMRADKLPVSTLGIRHAGFTVEATRAQYDQAFGAGGYGMVGDFDELAKELPKAVRILASAHIQKGVRRT